MRSTDTFDKLYKTLNKEQKKAVDAIDGPVMVVAGPGTGKTTILTLRIANILLKTDTKPENILALTFTNSGVHSMRKRLVETIGDEAYRVNIFTFHSFAEYVTKEFSFYFEDKIFSNIASDLDKVEIIEEIIKTNNFKSIVNSFDPMLSLNNIRFAIDSIKHEGLSPEELKKKIPKWKEELLSNENVYYKRKFGKYNAGDPKPSELKRIEDKILKVEEIVNAYKIYQQKITENKLYDFSDIIIGVLKALKENKNLKLDLQEQFQYILIDEHQDTNDGQNKLVEFLTDAEHLDGRPNVFAVGDEKQSIYRFQGASEKTFNYFKNLYKDVEVIALTENYRSSFDILESSHNVIINEFPKTAKLNSNLKTSDSPKVKIREFSSYKFELLNLVKDIKNKINSGVDPNEIAVIFRKNNTAKDLEEILSKEEIPHTLLSREDILSDPNIQNLITLLTVVQYPENNHNLGKAFLIDFLNFDPYDSVSTLNHFYRQNRVKKISLFEFIKKDKKYKNFLELLKTLKNKSNNSTFPVFFKDFLQASGYFDQMLKAEDSQDQLIKIDKLFDEIKRQVETNKNYHLVDFIKFTEDYQKYGLRIETNDPEVIAGVKLMTAHRSKGLEFEHVYIINAIRNNWEGIRSGPQISLPIENYKGGVNDERRLFYVAITRAKTDLNITYSRVDWEGRERDKSQFIHEIGDRAEFLDSEDFEKDNIKNLSTFFSLSKIEKTIWNKEYLKELFFSKNLSVSALNNYISCPNKYLFRNLIQLPSTYTTHQIFGNVIHGMLEKFFKKSQKEQRFLTKRNFLEIFKESMLDSSLSGYDYDRYEEKGLKFLENYYDKRKSDWVLQSDLEVRVEKDFELNAKDKITLSGILDKIEYLDSKDNGNIRVIDYKTGKAFSKKLKIHKEDLKRQLAFYHVLLEGYKSNSFKIESTILDFVESDELFNYKVSKKDTNDIKNYINIIAKDVVSGSILSKTCNKKDCEYCKMRI